jgi:hypothetical protein
MDNAYFTGHDYDTYRSNYREVQWQELADDVQHRSRRKKRMPIQAVLLVLLILVLSIGYYALRFIPLFDIDDVSVTVRGGFSQVPEQARDLLAEMPGQSLMGRAPRILAHELEKIPVVSDVQVRRRLFSTISVELEIAEPGTFVAAVTAEDLIDSIYFEEAEKLVPIDLKDFRAFGNRVFVVEVSETYAAHLEQYGIDQGMQQAIALAREMGMDEDGRYRIIGRIRYEGDMQVPFGHMMLTMPAYNSVLSIREPVSESRLHDAVRLIKLEREQNQRRNIALMGQLRYDLYAQSLVRRF